MYVYVELCLFLGIISTNEMSLWLNISETIENHTEIMQCKFLIYFVLTFNNNGMSKKKECLVYFIKFVTKFQ